MSFENVKTRIEQLIRNAQSDLIIISGAWGVGKTYFWNSLINTLKQNNQLGLQKYIYVSLFGVKDIETIKGQITASYLLNKYSSSSRINKWLTWIGNRDLQKKVGEFSQDVPYLKYINFIPVEFANIAAFMLVQKAIICFDDFERKTEALKAKEILGLADLLKEQKACKVVFILNHDKLRDEDKKEFAEYTEKLVDWSFTFEPTPEVVFDYVFSRTDPFYELIRPKCIQLGIKNVRVLKRIVVFLEEITPHLEKIENAVTKDVISSLILFVWCHYEQEVERPSFEFLKTYTSYLYDLRKRYPNSNNTEEFDDLHSLLLKYGYQETDDIDLCLMDFVKRGYIDVTTFETSLMVKNTTYLTAQGEEEYSQTWNRLYRNQIGDNEKILLISCLKPFGEILKVCQWEIYRLLPKFLDILNKPRKLKELLTSTLQIE
jgi:hypothetical protein